MFKDGIQREFCGSQIAGCGNCRSVEHERGHKPVKIEPLEV
jgi:hypothetical protein